MSFNSKSPTVKRILKEAHELSTSPSPDYQAAPLEDNIFEWHFTIRGAPSSAFASGLYHGRIVLPPTYPLRPPSFRFLTPSGRFEVNREICLSISGHHEESWQPAWGLRTALVALRSFMETEAKGQVGGVEATKNVRERLAGESRSWRCHGCGGRSNEQIIKEVEQAAARQGEEGQRKEEVVPKELSLGYKDELNANISGKGNAKDVEGEPASNRQGTPTISATPAIGSPETHLLSTSTGQGQSAIPASTRTMGPAPPRQATTVDLSPPQMLPPWIDKAIVGITVALAYMLLRKFLAIT